MKKRITSRGVAAPSSSPAGAVSLVKRVAALNRWREQYNPLWGLTLKRAVQLSSEYFIGAMADLQWTNYFIEQTDADLSALIERRSSRILEMDYQIQPIDGADEKLAEEQGAFLRERFDAIDNLYEAIEHLVLASFRGYAHCEKWRGDDGEINHLEVVDQWNAVRDGLRGEWKYNPEAKQVLFGGLPDANLMTRENFVYREVRRPINRIALMKFVRGNLSEKDWDAYVEIYGIPGGVTIGPPNVAEDKAPLYEAAAKDLSEGASGYLPNGSQWIPNIGPRNSQPFKERLDHLSEKLILAGTGGMLTMLATNVGLNGAGLAKAHTDVFEQIAKGEARRISEVLTRDLSQPWLEAAFPGQKCAAYFAIASNVETDVGSIVAHIKMLHDAGYQVDATQVTEDTGYTVTLAPTPPPPLTPPPGASVPTIANRDNALAVGRDALFQAHAVAAELAARRPVFRPLAVRLAALAAAPDATARAVLAAQFKADSAALYAAVIAAAPDLAQPAQEAIGCALISGFGEATAAKAKSAPKSASGVSTPLPDPRNPA